MNCLKREKQIALYVEGDLPKKEATVLARHMEECRQCQQLLHRLQESQSILRSVAEEPMPAAIFDNFPRKVMNEIEFNPPLGQRLHFPWNYSWRWTLGFAGAVAAVIAGFWIGLTYVGHGAKEKQLARQSMSSSDRSLKQVDRSFSELKPKQHAQQSREEKSSDHPRQIQEGKSGKPVRPVLPVKKNQAGGKIEDQVALAGIHKAMNLWQEMASNVEERERESTKAKPEGIPDRLVAKLATQDPNIIIYWLEDAGRGKTNAIQN